jgi:hypothetical protein
MHRPSVVFPVTALLFLMLVVSAAVDRTSAEDNDPAANHPVVGAWLVDQNVADTADPPALSIFMAEGTAYEANPAVGDGVGVWRATGERTAAATFVFQVVGEDGAIQATVKARADLEVDASGDAFTSVYAYEGTAPDGTVAFSGEATGHGTRLAVEPRLPPATPAATPNP